MEFSGNVLPDVRTDPLASGTIPLPVGMAPELQEQPCQPQEQLNQTENISQATVQLQNFRNSTTVPAIRTVPSTLETTPLAVTASGTA